MLPISPAILAKINNPIQLPSNQGEPILFVEILADGVVYDVGPHVIEGTINSRSDDYIYNSSLTINKAAVSGSTLDNPNVPFHPGMRVYISVKFGDSSDLSSVESQDPIYIGYFIIGEISYDDTETFTISGSNNIGSALSKCSMGETIELTGTSGIVGSQIMDLANVSHYFVTAGTYEWTYTYKASDTCMDALEQMYPIFPKDGMDPPQPGFGILERPDGRVIFGYWRDRCDPNQSAVEEWAIPVENYAIDIKKDCFTLSTRKNYDKCYARVFATGKAADGFDLEQIILDVENFYSWNIPSNKIYFADFNGYTMQEWLQDWAETIAEELKENGITDEVTGPFRPQFTPGDIVTFKSGSTVLRQGVMTSITHHIGIKGFSTDYSVDSGGVVSAASGWTSSMKANGYNRRQKLADTVREIAEQVEEKAIAKYDPVSVENKYDNQDHVKTIVAERNEMKIVYDGRNWQNLLPSSGGNPDPNANAGS